MAERRRGARWARQRTTLAVLALVLAVAACTPNTADTSRGPTSATSSQTSAPTSTGALAGVNVPDAFTPLTVQPISQPTFPFPGSDNKYHLAFDVQITNAAAVPATLDAVDVVDAHDPTKVLASFSGKQLVDPTCNYGDCNRLRLLSTAPPPPRLHPAATAQSSALPRQLHPPANIARATPRFHARHVGTIPSSGDAASARL